MIRICTLLVLVAAVGAPIWGCSDDAEASAAGHRDGVSGVVIEPPFAVAGEAAGLLLVWFDHRGVHQAARRSDIPWSRRRRVRVESLLQDPDERLDPAYVYVADMREAGQGGSYPVRRISRGQFEAWVAAAGGGGGEWGPAPDPGQEPYPNADPAPGEGAPAASPSGSGAIIVYGASWCGACRAAASFFRRRGVEFQEKDIERDASARDAMEAGMRRAGLRGDGIPVIDFRGRWIQGFDEREFDRLLRESGAGR